MAQKKTGAKRLTSKATKKTGRNRTAQKKTGAKRPTSKATKKTAKNRTTARPTAQKRSLRKKEAEETLRKDAEKVKPGDVEKMLKKSKEIQEKFETETPLAKFLDDLKLLFAIVRDYWNGKYREIPYWSIVAIVAALLYVLNPFDLIPDIIPVIGYVDDAAVVAACLRLVRKDLHKYKKWRETNAG